MKLGNFFLFTVMPFVVGILIGMIINPQYAKQKSDGQATIAPTSPGPQVTVFTLNVVTVGNTSWVKLEIAGNPSDGVSEILKAKHLFEQSFPDLEVTNWHIEKQQGAYGRSAKIFGLWIDHRPRVTKTPPATQPAESPVPTRTP